MIPATYTQKLRDALLQAKAQIRVMTIDRDNAATEDTISIVNEALAIPVPAEPTDDERAAALEWFTQEFGRIDTEHYETIVKALQSLPLGHTLVEKI